MTRSEIIAFLGKIGKKGGQAKSAAKTKANRKYARKKRPRTEKPCGDVCVPGCFLDIAPKRLRQWVATVSGFAFA